MTTPTFSMIVQFFPLDSQVKMLSFFKGGNYFYRETIAKSDAYAQAVKARRHLKVNQEWERTVTAKYDLIISNLDLLDSSTRLSSKLFASFLSRKPLLLVLHSAR